MRCRTVTNRRGSTFYLCRLSESDHRYQRYPALPVTSCDGYRRDLPLDTPGERVPAE